MFLVHFNQNQPFFFNIPSWNHPNGSGGGEQHLRFISISHSLDISLSISLLNLCSTNYTPFISLQKHQVEVVNNLAITSKNRKQILYISLVFFFPAEKIQKRNLSNHVLVESTIGIRRPECLNGSDQLVNLLEYHMD